MKSKYSPMMNIEASEGLKTHISDVYPNPSNQHINFSLYTLSPENIEIQLIDFTGNEALNFIPKITEGKNDISIDISNLKNGIYILKIISQNPEDVMIQKMIKN